MRFGRVTNEIRDAFQEAFPASLKEEFALVIRDAYLTDGKRQYTYDDFSEGARLYETVVQKAVDWAERSDSLLGLVNAAVQRRPNDAKLAALAARLHPLQHQFRMLEADPGQLERIVLKGVLFE